MGKRLKNAPIYHALVQVHFNAILPMEQYVPSIQDSLRKLGFPDYERSVIATVNVNLAPAGEANAAVPAIQQMVRHQFLNESKTSGFVLENRGLVFSTTDYETVTPFMDSFVAALAIVDGAVGGLSYSERLGTRCLDAVQSDEDDLREYFTPSVLGITDKLAPRKLVHSIAESRTKTGNTTLVSRVLFLQQETKGACFPSEYGNVPLKLKEKFQEITGYYAVIDTDCWLEERQKFDLSMVKGKLLSLHDEVSNAFDLVVTAYAKKKWE
jgi:uncharacterized protein (TIGR04255 family)